MAKKSSRNTHIPTKAGVSIIMGALLLTIVVLVGYKENNLLSSNAALTTSPYCAPAKNPSVTVNSLYNGYFSSQVGPGWVGGDATYSTRLPNGQESWVFSDTLIGTANSSGIASFTGMPHNTELVGTGANLTNDYAGTMSAPQAIISDTNGNAWEVAGTYIENNRQLIFVNEFGTVAGSPFAAYTGKSGVAVMTVNGKIPTLSSIVSIPTDSTTQWGNAVTSDSIYNYIYGNDTNTTSGAFYGMKLARVAKGYTTQVNKWQYWNGSKWVSGEANAIALTTGNELTGVNPQLGSTGYIAVSIQNNVFTDNNLYVSYACSPQGPWSTPTIVYTIPEVSQYKDEIAYIPTFHPELSSTSTGLLVSYNVDSTDGLGALAQNVHQYQPRFLILK